MNFVYNKLKFIMKKILFLSFICLFLFKNVGAKSYLIGDNISGEIEFYKKYKFKLPAGNWTVADRYVYSFYGFTSKGYILLKIDNNKAIELISIGEQKIPAKWVGYINPVINDVVFKNKYDGCYEKPEYYVLEFYRKGSTFNCFWVYHLDTYKELFNPDDPELRGIYAQFSAWLRDSKIEIPNVTIGSSHWYFSRLKGGKWFSLQHLIDPRVLGAPQNKFINEERSEYHKYNISNYPQHKNIMSQFIKMSAKRHKQFELEVQAKDNHKLNLNKYFNSYKDDDENKSNNEIISQLKKLNDLYNAGALTKDEFKKAKDKILD